MALRIDMEQLKQFAGAYARVHGFAYNVDELNNVAVPELTSIRFEETGMVITFTEAIFFVTDIGKIDDKTTRAFANLLAEELSHVLTVMEFKPTLLRYFGQTPFIVDCVGTTPLECVVVPLEYGIGETDQF